MPCYPNCKTNHSVSSHGFHADQHGQIVVDTRDNYFVVGLRYKWQACQKRKQAIKISMAAAASAQNVEVVIPKINFH